MNTKYYIRLAPILQAFGWIGIVLLAILMLIPGPSRPNVLSSGLSEHFLAYGLTALTLIGGYWHIRHTWLIVIGLTGYAGALEALQLIAPGRHAKMIDFLMSLLGIWCAYGALLVAMPLCNCILSRKGHMSL